MRIKFLNNVLIIFDRFQMRHDWFFLACPAGYDGPMTFHGETSCYLLVSTGALADAARTSCQTITGGDLVSIEDQDEQNFVAGNTLNNQSHQLPQYFMDRIIKIWKLPSDLNKTSFFTVAGLRGGIVDEIHTGLNDRVVEDTFTWTDGSPFVYNNFEPGQPNNDGDCVVFRSSGRWYDRICNSSLPYICEIESMQAVCPTVRWSSLLDI